MKKVLITIRNIFLGVILIIYLSFIIIISTLLLNRNNYGVTQFGDKVLILVDEKIANDKYQDGNLVVLQTREISGLNIGEEVFIYQTNKKDKSVKIVVSEVGKINVDTTSPYIILKNEGTAWGEEFIAGTTYKTYESLGFLLSFVESKWVFFSLLIVPCFFILLYEIHLVIVTIKFGDMEDVEYEDNYKNELESKDAEIEELMKEIKKLKQEKKETKSKENDKISETKDKEVKKEK